MLDDVVVGHNVVDYIGTSIGFVNRNVDFIFRHDADMGERPEKPGARLRFARDKKGLTQTQLALKSGVRQSSISELEGDAYSPAGPKLIAICRALEVRPQWVITGERPMEPTSHADLGMDPKEAEMAAEMVRLYRRASPMWKTVLDSLPGLSDERREEVVRAIWEQMLKVGGVPPTPKSDRKRGKKA
jgi:transcriptional regulator with XRE-family HTH domain